MNVRNMSKAHLVNEFLRLNKAYLLLSQKRRKEQDPACLRMKEDLIIVMDELRNRRNEPIEVY